MSLKRWFVCVLLLMSTLPAAAQDGKGDVIYVPTPQVAVDAMLDMAKVTGRDFLIDLGSGDGRIVITAATRFGTHGLGVDLDSYLVKQARDAAQRLGVSDRARFIEQNLFDTDLSRATVISSYLLPDLNEKLRPKLLALKPGTRIVAHDYDMGEWLPDEQRTLIVPEKEVGDPGKSYVFFWVVPARIAGKWESLIYNGGRGVVYEFDFDQSFQKVSGDLKVDGRPARLPVFDVRGDQVSFEVEVPQGTGVIKQRFQGTVHQDKIVGTVSIAGIARPLPWSANLKVSGQMRISQLEGADAVPR